MGVGGSGPTRSDRIISEQNGERRWKLFWKDLALGLLTLVSLLLGAGVSLVWGQVQDKADGEAVAKMADDLDYLMRKSESDLENDALNRRVLNGIAKKLGIEPAGELVRPRPSEHRVHR